MLLMHKSINSNKRVQRVPYFHHTKFYLLHTVTYFFMLCLHDDDDKNDDEINIMQHMGQICG